MKNDFEKNIAGLEQNMNMLNNEIAELVGILLGDGCIGVYDCKTGNKIKKQYRVKVTLHSKDDVEYAKHVCKLLEKQFSVKPLIRFRKNENTMDILVFGQNFVKILTEEIGLKMSPKRHIAVIPKTLINSELELDVIRGYFDTDGSVVLTNNNGTLYPRLEMKICPSPMQKQIPEILQRHNFKFGVYDAGNGEVRVQLNGKKELEKWVSNIGFSNPKYQEKLKYFKKSSKTRH